MISIAASARPASETEDQGQREPPWNRIPDDDPMPQIIEMALDTARAEHHVNSPSPSPTSAQYFVSEASVYRLLRARGLITSPAYIVLKAASSRRRFACLPGNG